MTDDIFPGWFILLINIIVLITVTTSKLVVYINIGCGHYKKFYKEGLSEELFVVRYVVSGSPTVSSH